MNPIAQTFFINEPVDGSAGVYVTKIDLFFQSKSPKAAVTVQIRETDNGNPTSLIKPFSSVTLPSASVNVSQNASVATTFVFSSPVFLNSQQSYAFVVIPEDYSEDYKLWTSELASTVDITTGVPIKQNNDTGTLFLSSNGRQFTAVQTEDIKFQLYRAQFSSLSGTAAYKPLDEDRFYVKDIRGGDFQKGERIYVSNNVLNLAKIVYSQNTSNFISGETVYQANSTANIAVGQILLDSSHTMKLVNCIGEFVTSSYPNFTLNGATSLVSANVTSVNQNISATIGSKDIILPFNDYISTIDYANELVYFRNKLGTVTQTTQIESINNDGVTVTLKTPSFFTDNFTEFGLIRGKGKLFGFYGGPTKENITNPNAVLVSVAPIIANSTLNFANTKGNLMIGLSSKSSANIISLIDNSYNSLYIGFQNAIPPSTNVNFSFVGANNDSGRSMDVDYISLNDNVTTEFFDKERVIASRSNELSTLNGNSTLLIKADLSTLDPKVSPVIDDVDSAVKFSYNVICNDTELVGWRLNVSNNNGTFAVGDQVQQGNTSVPSFANGFISHIDDNQITVTGTYNNYFLTTENSGARLVNVSNPSINSVILAASKFGEINDFVNSPYSSRYISKTVILEEGQDAEDLRCYLTAYRPSGTKFNVYAKFKNKEDQTPFARIGWSILRELSSPTLLSSLTNKNDFVELEYGLPRSEELVAENCTCSTSSQLITMSTTQDLLKNGFIYIKDNNSTNFNVRQIMQVVDGNTLKLHVAPSFTSDNTAIGRIRYMNGIRSVFIYTENNNILRYVGNNDTVYDGYKNFSIKIIPLSDTSYIVPKCQDMRAIALQI
jgi:hypothetical protein